MGLQVGRGVLAARGRRRARRGGRRRSRAAAAAGLRQRSGSSTSPATAGEKLSYAERLGSAEPAKEQLKAEARAAPPRRSAADAEVRSAARPAPSGAARRAGRGTAASDRRTRRLAAPASTEPAGAGFAIQVAALRERDEADAIVKRLAGKGYPAYVVTPAEGRAVGVPRARRQVQGTPRSGHRRGAPAEGRAVQALDRPLVRPSTAAALSRACCSRCRFRDTAIPRSRSSRSCRCWSR